MSETHILDNRYSKKITALNVKKPDIRIFVIHTIEHGKKGNLKKESQDIFFIYFYK
jgi:hypothetical protein